MLITLAVLFILNIYCGKVSQSIFCNSKKNSMVELCHVAANNISDQEVLNPTTISAAISNLADDDTMHIIITDSSCRALLDTNTDVSTENKYIFYPEVVKALEGNDVFRWTYANGVIQAYAASPIFSYGELIGCVYITDYDVQQGALILSLQITIFTITLLLEIAVIFCSFVFSNTYTKRLKKIMSSIRNVRNGDYAHRLELAGHDELNILTDEFNDLIDRLQTSENKRNQFVSDASHELKTPLASIKLLSDSILQNNMDADTIREFVNDIGNEADRLNRMSQKLLTLSRIDAQTEVNTEVIYITPTIERVIRMLSATIENKGIHIHIDLAEDAPVLIAQDDLYQVIFNLTENAIKYNKTGGNLFITLKQAYENIVICIEDTGVGIPEESLSHIFERFYRVDKARVRSTGGSGLGLSIVRQIVKRNNGSIKAESKMGKGTRMTLHFPISKANGEEMPL